MLRKTLLGGVENMLAAGQLGFWFQFRHGGFQSIFVVGTAVHKLNVRFFCDHEMSPRYRRVEDVGAECDMY